jgi:hypothetical protein
MFYLIEGLTALFAVYCAYLNEVPVLKMIQHGASLSEEKKFHFANGAVKIIYSLSVTMAMGLPLFERLICFFTLGLIQWLVFDIALNLFLKKTWDYIGDTAWIDKHLTRLMPHGDAGEVKAILCLLFIIALNFLFHLI